MKSEAEFETITFGRRRPHTFVLRCSCGVTFLLTRPRRVLGWILSSVLEHEVNGERCRGSFTILHKAERIQAIKDAEGRKA